MFHSTLSDMYPVSLKVHPIVMHTTVIHNSSDKYIMHKKKNKKKNYSDAVYHA